MAPSADGVCLEDSYPQRLLVWEKELPLPPSINSYWKLNRQAGRIYVSAEGHQFTAQCFALVGERKPFECRLAMDVLVIPPNHRRRDVDNIQKCLLDSLTKCKVYLDDSQIDDLRVRRQPPTADRRGRIFVRLYRLSQDNAGIFHPDYKSPEELAEKEKSRADMLARGIPSRFHSK